SRRSARGLVRPIGPYLMPVSLQVVARREFESAECLRPYSKIPSHWRKRAEEARSIAQQLSNAEPKRKMLRVAAGFERLADHAQRRAEEFVGGNERKVPTRKAAPGSIFAGRPDRPWDDGRQEITNYICCPSLFA